MNGYILAVDPSLTSTGWAVIRKSDSEVIRVGKICTTNKTEEDARVFYIVKQLLSIAAEYGITEIPMEDSFVGKNMKTGIQLAKLRGAIVIGFMLSGCEVNYDKPSAIRKNLLGEGYGNAKKDEVATMIRLMYKNNKLVQNLGEFNDKQGKNKNSDMYDAICIGAAYISKTSKEKTA